ncbi:MAG TPA: quercetin 2,3-dioxygenase [Solirubrobacterales bacterium]|nr:quercetin 2,3-dioxygenase [Solirubrobacterales bacterium]
MALVSPITSYKLSAGQGLADSWWKTGRISTKVTGEQTGGSFSQIESIDPRGTATPLHLHRNEEEAFYVLEGELSVLVDGEWMELTAGDLALVPRNVPHAYVVTSERARMLVTFSPAGFEAAFAEIGVPVAESPQPPVETVIPSPQEMVAAFDPYGCEILGPPPQL